MIFVSKCRILELMLIIAIKSDDIYELHFLIFYYNNFLYFPFINDKKPYK